MKRSTQFVVSVPVIPAVTLNRMAQYIKSAIENHASHAPEFEPLAGAFRANERSKVYVRRFPKVLP